ncbi:MAG: retron Eco8 family effector endonuclease [Lachnospiraceae bacterium]|nr:retron Eco8 family effector endonuclease [Lachnospiraceae bacterium]
MGIVRVIIKNYKAIKNVDIVLSKDSNNVAFLLGKNGTGKTTIIDSIRYFYRQSESDGSVERIIDRSNPYVQSCSIEVFIDISNLEGANGGYITSLVDEWREYIKDNTIRIKYTQYKNGRFNWYPVSDRRKVYKLLRLFPIYHIDTRAISLTDWGKLWNIIGDIGVSFHSGNNSKLREDMAVFFDNSFKGNFKNKYDDIQEIFKNSSVKIKDRDYRMQYVSAMKLLLGGDAFITDEYDLSFFSDGNNSLKFIQLYIRLVSSLSKYTMKECLILLDEPEIGLHPQYQEELADLIKKVQGEKVHFIISSHSAHLVSEVVNNDIECVCYCTSIRNGSAIVEMVPGLFSEESHVILTDNEATCYFADAILFIEGETEAQLFRDKTLIELFPELKRVTVYNTNSNNKLSRSILPGTNNLSIPYLVLLDMDKVLNYNTKRSKFEEKKPTILSFIDSDLSKEKYYFYKESQTRKRSSCEIKRNIGYVINELDTSYFERDFWTEDGKYHNLIREIKKYYLLHHVALASTTIEGCLVNDSNCELFEKYIKYAYLKRKMKGLGGSEEKRVKLENKFYNEITHKLNSLLFDSNGSNRYNSAVLRFIVHGKTDNLKNINSNNNKNDNQKRNSEHYYISNGMYDGIIEIRKKCGIEKTSGWIGDFLSYYKTIMIKENKDPRKEFKKYFPELNEVLQEIKNMIY